MVVLFDRFHLPEDVFSIIFATEQQQVVARLLIRRMIENGNTFDKSEMSDFATRLHDGRVEIEIRQEMRPVKKMKISYNKRQFYDRILTPMKGMGMIDYDMYKKKYAVSDRFNKAMIKIGLMWIRKIQ